MSDVHVLAIDLAKRSFQVCATARGGAVLFNRTVSRAKLMQMLRSQALCIVAMEACADLAAEAGVSHLVYSSGAAVGDAPTGMGHFDSKAQIEAYVRTLPIMATIVRPAAFMEMLMMPGFGLDKGQFNFFMRPERAMQFIAVEDIGKFVAAVFADPAGFAGQTFEIASDQVTGEQLQALFSKVAGRPITYHRFREEVLAANEFLAQLTALYDDGRLSGRADLEKLRTINPQMMSFPNWLETSGLYCSSRLLVRLVHGSMQTSADSCFVTSSRTDQSHTED